MAFVRDNNVFVLRVEGGAPEQLTYGDQGQWSPAWSPDGRDIVFIAADAGAPRVWRVNAAGGDPRPFKRTLASGGLTWAPGKRILYQKPGNTNFSLLDPVTEEETPLLRDESRGWIFGPIYSPDGTRVAAYWNRKLGPDKREQSAWVVSLADGAERRLGAGLPLDDSPIGWSADGAWVYVAMSKDDQTVIVKAPAAGGPPVEVVKLPFKEVWGADVARDGSRFVVTVGESRSDVWIVEDFDPDVE